MLTLAIQVVKMSSIVNTLVSLKPHVLEISLLLFSLGGFKIHAINLASAESVASNAFSNACHMCT